MAMTLMNESPVAAPPRLPHPSATTSREDLSGLEDRELLVLNGSLPRSSETGAAARDLLVTRYRNLVRSCVRRYSRGPEPVDDLMQVGYVGLLKAINNFDIALGFSLASYAEPCIVGELKRHFRDTSWQMRVGRPLQERVLEVRRAERRLTQQLGRRPAESELAADLGVCDAEIREAWLAELMLLRPLSLDGTARDQTGSDSLSNLLGQEDPRLEHLLGMQSIGRHWGELPARQQQVVVLYFYRGMTQERIGKQLGVSQMQVSRLLAEALGYLRPRLYG
jgi:RNA polymerase sigma-B factor